MGLEMSTDFELANIILAFTLDVLPIAWANLKFLEMHAMLLAKLGVVTLPDCALADMASMSTGGIWVCLWTLGIAWHDSRVLLLVLLLRYLAWIVLGPLGRHVNCSRDYLWVHWHLRLLLYKWLVLWDELA